MLVWEGTSKAERKHMLPCRSTLTLRSVPALPSSTMTKPRPDRPAWQQSRPVYHWQYAAHNTGRNTSMWQSRKTPDSLLSLISNMNFPFKTSAFPLFPTQLQSECVSKKTIKFSSLNIKQVFLSYIQQILAMFKAVSWCFWLFSLNICSC